MSKTTRLLSLILVIAMAFSLFAVGGSAKWADNYEDFTDAKTVNYKEAVDVLTYINVFNGIDGAFKPEGNLQRDQAAKIVSLLVTGATGDADFTQTNTVFTDVAKEQWASGYIQWAYNKGIINGVGDNKFAPTSNVTVLQFLKLVLTGLGWGAKGEFVGKGWDTAVYVKATELGLWGDVTPVVSDRVATREEAAEFALQALSLSKVYLNDAYDYLYADGTKAGGDKKVQQLFEIHGLEKAEGIDSIGYVTKKWIDGSNNNTIAVVDAKSYRTVNIVSGVTKSSLLGNLKSAKDEYGYGDVYINGYALKTNTDLYAFLEGVIANPAIYYGSTLTEYVSSGYLTHITLALDFAGVVSNVSTKNNTFAVTVYKGVSSADGALGGSPVTYSNQNNDAGYAIGDVLAVIPKLDSSFSAVASTSSTNNLLKHAKATVGGTYGGKNQDNSLYLSGKLATQSVAFSAPTASSELGGGTYWLGASGAYIRFVKSVAITPTKYAFIAEKPEDYDYLDNKSGFVFTNYGTYDLYNASGEVSETVTSISGYNNAYAFVDYTAYSLIAYDEASGFYAGGWRTLANEKSTLIGTKKWEFDGSYLVIAEKDYSIVSSTFVVDITDEDDIDFAPNTRKLTSENSEITAIYTNPNKPTQLLGVVFKTEVSTTELSAGITAAETKVAGVPLAEIDEDLVAAYNTALAAAKAVLAKAAPTKSEVEKAIADLEAAVEALVPLTFADLITKYTKYTYMSTDDVYLFANVIDYVTYATTDELPQTKLIADLAKVGRGTVVEIDVTFDDSFVPSYDLSELDETTYGVLTSEYGFYAIAVLK